MTIKKITNFTFPISEKPLSQDAYFRVLSGAKNGFYPFSENGLWHGGIHIDNGVLCEINSHDTRLNCIGNGEVIAYRVNDVYPKIVYGKEPKNAPFIGDEQVAYCSTGFTLVRHYFCMPKVAGESEKPPYITLYSLYMHQLDWYGYQQYNNDHPHNPLPIPTFWHLYEGRVSESTKESIKGSAIRIGGSKTTVVGLLLKGSKVKLGDEIERYDESGTRISRRWYKLESLEEGCIVTENAVHYQLGTISGYVYAGELNEHIESDSAAHQAKVYSIKIAGNDKVGIQESNVPGIVVYGEANTKSVLGYLPKDTRFKFDGQDNGYAKIEKIDGNYVPASLIVTHDNGLENASEDSPIHQGWVKIASLSSLKYRPKECDKVVILDKPVAIKGGDFVGYLGHNVSRHNAFPQSEHFSLATMKRASDDKLSVLGHIELFTCDDLPDFMTKTRALAEKLPESEKTLILVEPGAQLINERPTDGKLSRGLHIKKIMESAQSYYIQVSVDYVLTLNRYQCVRENMVSSHSLNAADLSTTYRLTAENKQSLLSRYRFEYPELTEESIPDEVELTGYPLSDEPDEILSEQRNLMNPYLAPKRNNHANSDEVKIRFNRFGDSLYWVRADDVLYRFGDDMIYQAIPYWEDFPLSLNHLPKADIHNTVHYARTFFLTSIKQDNLTATDAHYHTWAYIRAGNKEGSPIQGWVNIAKGDKDYLQPHIKLASPWEWVGFNTIEERATTGEQLGKLTTNKRMTLGLEDYTESMTALHRILTQTPMNRDNAKRSRLLPFTTKHLKEGLQTPWTAELIGRLAIKYESEWYADDSLSKWNEIDVFYQQECEQKRQAILDKLNELNITRPSEREHAFKLLDQLHQQNINEWQIEKQQRIKPSLWWKDIAEAQASQTANTDTATTDNTPVLSSLSSDGKAWFLHPVGMREFIIDDSLITLEMLIAAHPSGSKSYYNEILPYLNQYALVYELTEPKEIAHFLSQIGHESGFKSDSEDLYYTERTMKKTFGCKGGKKNYDHATDSCDLGQLRPKLWTNTYYYEKNPEHLGNYVYANRMGNGDESSGDGYRYRGRGVIQLTGKDAYSNFTLIHNRNNPDDIQDFVANPDLLKSSIQYCIESAFVFWFTKRGKPDLSVNRYVKLCDLAKTGEVQEVTQLVNGGQNGYVDRKQRFNRIARLLGLQEDE